MAVVEGVCSPSHRRPTGREADGGGKGEGTSARSHSRASLLHKKSPSRFGQRCCVDEGALEGGLIGCNSRRYTLHSLPAVWSGAVLLLLCQPATNALVDGTSVAIRGNMWDGTGPVLRDSFFAANSMVDAGPSKDAPGTEEHTECYESGATESAGTDSSSGGDLPTESDDSGRTWGGDGAGAQLPKIRGRKARKGRRGCKYAEGCDKWAYFGEEERVPLFCKQHKLPSHRNVVSRRCHSPGCDKRPVFGDPCDKAQRFCRAHKLGHHVDIVNKKCLFPHCRKHPIYGDPIDKDGLVTGDAIYCAEHKCQSHVNVR